MLKTINFCNQFFKRFNSNNVKCLVNKTILHTNRTPIESSQIVGLNITNSFSVQQVRFKKTTDKSRGLGEQSDEEIDEEDYIDGEEDKDLDVKSIDTSNFQPGFKIVKKHISSLRFDSVLAAGLNISRNKVDELFYSSKLRLNGNKLLKKSSLVKDKDRLDLIGDIDEKTGKRTLKRVVLYKICESKSKSNKNAKPQCILISWKTGLFEEDAYKSIHL